MTEPEPESPDTPEPAGTQEPPAQADGPETQESEETQEEKRARVMSRLAEILRADPPDLSDSGPVTAGALPELPSNADEFDQESAAELFAALEQFFKKPDRPR